MLIKHSCFFQKSIHDYCIVGTHLHCTGCSFEITYNCTVTILILEELISCEILQAIV